MTAAAAPSIGAEISSLDRYLAAHVRGFGGLREVVALTGGQSNPTYRLRASSGDYVLRRKPFGRILPSAHAVDREYRVMKALSGTPVPVPAMLHYCDDATVLGAPFYVMAHVAGASYFDPRLPELPRAARARIYAELGRVLAALHSVDPVTVGLGDFGRAAGWAERQIRRWTEQYRAAETERRPDMEAVIEWLPRHLPPDDGRVAIVHGDYRLDNVLIGNDGTALALIDWELSTLGHPLADLAYQCAQWRLPPGTLRGLAGEDRVALGLPTEEEYVAAYLSARGHSSLDHWTFHLVLALFRLASICQGVYRRSLDGNAASSDAHDFGRRTAVIAAHAAALLD